MTKKTGGLQAYRRNEVMTASKETILLLLYEGVIRFCKGGLEAIEQNRIEERSKALLRAQDIVNELRCTLNFKVGGELANDLERIYDYVNERLIYANINNDAASVREALNILEPLYVTWQQAVHSIKKEKQDDAKSQAE